MALSEMIAGKGSSLSMWKSTCIDAETRNICPSDLLSITNIIVHTVYHWSQLYLYHVPDRRSSTPAIDCSCFWVLSYFNLKVALSKSWSGRLNTLFSISWPLVFLHKEASVITVKLTGVLIRCCKVLSMLYLSLYLHCLWMLYLSHQCYQNHHKLAWEKNQRKRWLRPFSAFPGSSIKYWATLGWLNLPIA